MADQITYDNKTDTTPSNAAQWTGPDVNEVKSVVNTNATELDSTTAKANANESQIDVRLEQNLGAFDPATFTFNQSGVYNDYTPPGNVTLDPQGTPTINIWQKVTMLFDGVKTLTKSPNSVMYNATSGQALPLGAYDIWISYVGGKFYYNVQDNDSDVIPPVLATATVENANPNQIVLTYTEALDETSVPVTGDYTPSGGKTVTLVAVSGDTVTLTVDSDYVNTDTITISYTSGTNPLRDLIGNNAANLVNRAVTNNIQGSYVFANTHELVVDNAGEGVLVTENSLWPTGDFSIEMWLETPATPTNGDGYVLLDDTDAGAFFAFIIDMQGTPVRWRMRVFTGSGADSISKPGLTNIPGSTLQHLIFTYNATAETIGHYLNGSGDGGTQTESGNFTGIPARVGTVLLDFANSQGGTTGFGNWQLARMYNEVLSPAEVTQLYNGGTPVGLDVALQGKCVQENLFNNTPLADNIGFDGVNQGGVTYQTV